MDGKKHMQMIKGKKILFVGRFQPFHLGHYRMIEKIVDDAEYVIIAIGSSKKSFTLKNPYTGGERLSMIWKALKPSWRTKCILTTIDDINRYNIWVNHVEDLVPDFDVVVTNSNLTRLLFEKKGYQVYSPGTFSRITYRGEHIRASMQNGHEWKELLPVAIVKYLGEIDGVERIKKLL